MKKKHFLSVLVTLLAVSLMAACGEQKEIMEIETVSVSEEQEVESVSSGEEPVKEEEMVPEEQEAEQKTEAEEEPVVEPEPEPIVEPEPEPVVEPEPEIVTPSSSSTLYVKDGRIYIDARENPDYLQSCFFIDFDRHGGVEYLRMWEQLDNYVGYMPCIGEITTYFPVLSSLGTFTAPLYDGGTFYIHQDEKMEENLMFNLAYICGQTTNLHGGCCSFNGNTDISHENGVNYVGCFGDGRLLTVVQYYVYYLD